MKKIFVMIVAVLCFALMASATDFPSSEVFLGYNFTKFHPDSGYIPNFNANGGNAQYTYNFYRWLGVTADFGAVTKGVINQTPWDTTALSYTIGPRLTYHNHSRFIPYGQVLFGGSYITTSTQVGTLVTPSLVAPRLILPPNLIFTTRINAAKNGFAMLVGGGLDIKLSKHFSFRPAEFSYFLARLPNEVAGNDVNHNNFRYTAGISFLIGAK
jgi:opacity protein-like surface antigen